MVNLQQYYLEEYLLTRAAALPSLEIRWKNKVTALQPPTASPSKSHLQVETPDGSYGVSADWVLVADGARSPLRRMLGLDIEGKVFQDRFLIADVVMKADFPAERWFWFDPPFHRNQSVLLHREADNVWRIDFQLGWNVDPEEEKKPENVIPRIQAMLGPDHAFDLEWVSVYTFQCRRMARFRHGPIIFLGDAAHQVSPFGARGANSGIQDADNLGWKLDAVLSGRAPEILLDTYDLERTKAADENILNSTRSTDFITPKSEVSRLFRDSVLHLARELPFARALVNSGRLSVPTFLADSPLNTHDSAADHFSGRMVPGAPADDAPIEVVSTPLAVVGLPGRQSRETPDQWLLSVLGHDFVLMVFLPEAQAVPSAVWDALVEVHADHRLRLVVVTPHRAEATILGAQAVARGLAPTVVLDLKGCIMQRYDLSAAAAYLFRPDQHVVARWRQLTATAVGGAYRRALGHDLDHELH
jgi:3-(3-hydroxy-phenyl)propionate hydroxylase